MLRKRKERHFTHFTEIKNAILQVDGLILDGKAFTTSNMHELPSFLQPEKAALIQTDDTVVFFTRHAIFSNLHSIEVRIDGGESTTVTSIFIIHEGENVQR